MTRRNPPDNPLLAEVLRNRAVVRGFLGGAFLAWIVAVVVFTAWQEAAASANASIGPGKDHWAAQRS